MNESKSNLFANHEVPLYYQLGTILREQIANGSYGIGDRLPTEADLVGTYGVSRITVRQALKSLEEERLIRREAGRGTFVIGRPAATRTEARLPPDDLITVSLAISIRLLDVRQVVASEEDTRILGLPEKDRLTQCLRLGLYQDEPYSYTVLRVAEPLASCCGSQEWGAREILKSFSTAIGRGVTPSGQSVSAALADATLGARLMVRIGAPLLTMERRLLLEDGQPVAIARSFYRSDLYRLSLQEPLPKNEPGKGPGQIGENPVLDRRTAAFLSL